MSFNTSSDRILVKDAAGRTTLDTDQPMPHILQTAAVSLSCGFPGDGGVSYSHNHTSSSNLYNYQECGNETQCGFQNVCEWKFVNGQYQQVCENQYVCEPVYVCHTRQGFETRTLCTVYPVHAPREWSQVQNIVSIINGIEADFIQVSVEAARTGAGEDPRYGTFQAVLPAGRFLSQGSVLLESGFVTGGSSWMRRIMSIYVENGIVKVLFKHSNRQVVGKDVNNGVVGVSYSPPGSYTGPPVFLNPDSNPGAVNTASSFAFNFYVTIGKFTK